MRIAERPTLPIAIAFVGAVVVAMLAWSRAPEKPSHERFAVCPLTLANPSRNIAGVPWSPVVERAIRATEERMAVLRRLQRLVTGFDVQPDERIVGALAARPNDIEGCFDEWSERYPGDLRLDVSLAISPGGVPSATRAWFPDRAPDAWEQRSAMTACVAGAIERVRFAGLASEAHATVTITWVDDTLGFTAKISTEGAPGYPRAPRL